MVIFFKTDKNHYLYEAYNNNIFRISDIAYKGLPLLLKGATAKELRTKLSQFRPSEINRFIKTGIKHGHFKYLLGNLPAIKASNPVNSKQFFRKTRTDISQMQLEVTSDCNLRCKYCILGKAYPMEKEYSSTPMRWETAKKAVNFLKEHSSHSKNTYIAFYGGEPLMCFDLIKKTVSYSKKVLKGKKIGFRMTTNATLLDDEKCKFLIKEGFRLMVSLDGSKSVHNRNRVFKSGKGSFDATMAGVLRLKQMNEAYFSKKVEFNVVIHPPYKLKEIEDFFMNNLPCENVVISFIKTQNTVYFKKHPLTSADRCAFRKLVSNFVEARKLMGEKRPDSVYATVIETPLLIIHKRSDANIFNTDGTLTGTCLPGVRKLFVATNGDFHICEKIEHRRPIGNVCKGFDFENINKLFDEYYSDVSKVCTKCWALRLCGFCVAHAMKCGEFSIENKRKCCIGNRKSLKRELRRYCDILEANPRAFDYMDKIKVV